MADLHQPTIVGLRAWPYNLGSTLPFRSGYSPGLNLMELELTDNSEVERFKGYIYVVIVVQKVPVFVSYLSMFKEPEYVGHVYRLTYRVEP